MTTSTGHPAHSCGGAFKHTGCACPVASENGAARSHAEPVGGTDALAVEESLPPFLQEFSDQVLGDAGSIRIERAFEEPSSEDYAVITIGEQSWQINDLAGLWDELNGHAPPSATSIAIGDALDQARPWPQEVGELHVSALPAAHEPMQIANAEGRRFDEVEVIVPPGVYVLGDPCYAVPDDQWGVAIETSGCFGAAPDADERRSPVGYFAARDMNGEMKRFEVLGLSTAYGDGVYLGNDGCEYPVDAGMIGLVPADSLTREERDAYFDVSSRKLNRLVTFTEPTKCTRTEDGMLTFGAIVITTGDDEEDEQEHCDRCGNQTNRWGECDTCEECQRCGGTMIYGTCQDDCTDEDED